MSGSAVRSYHSPHACQSSYHFNSFFFQGKLNTKRKGTHTDVVGFARPLKLHKDPDGAPYIWVEIDEIRLEGTDTNKIDFLDQLRLVDSPYTLIKTGADFAKLGDNQAVMYWIWRTEIEEKEGDKSHDESLDEED